MNMNTLKAIGGNVFIPNIGIDFEYINKIQKICADASLSTAWVQEITRPMAVLAEQMNKVSNLLRDRFGELRLQIESAAKSLESTIHGCEGALREVALLTEAIEDGGEARKAFWKRRYRALVDNQISGFKLDSLKGMQALSFKIFDGVLESLKSGKADWFSVIEEEGNPRIGTLPKEWEELTLRQLLHYVDKKVLTEIIRVLYSLFTARHELGKAFRIVWESENGPPLTKFLMIEMKARAKSPELVLEDFDWLNHHSVEALYKRVQRGVAMTARVSGRRQSVKACRGRGVGRVGRGKGYLLSAPRLRPEPRRGSGHCT